MQLLVLGQSCGEDGRHRQHGRSGWVPHLVDHDGGQGQAENLRDGGGVVKAMDRKRRLPDSSEQSGGIKARINKHGVCLTARMARVKTTPIMMSTTSRR